MELGPTVGGYQLQELTECPRCGTLYVRNKNLAVPYCGTCAVYDTIKEFWQQVMYLKYGIIPV